MVATRKNRRQQRGGQIVPVPPPVPPTYTCAAGTGTLISGQIGMCGKCDTGFTLNGNMCIPNPVQPTMVNAVRAIATCPPPTTLNGTLCEYPVPKVVDIPPMPPITVPAKRELAVFQMKTATIVPAMGSMPAITQQVVDMGQPPKCNTTNAILRGMECFSCEKGVFDGGAMCATCPEGTAYTNGMCYSTAAKVANKTAQVANKTPKVANKTAAETAAKAAANKMAANAKAAANKVAANAKAAANKMASEVAAKAKAATTAMGTFPIMSTKLGSLGQMICPDGKVLKSGMCFPL